MQLPEIRQAIQQLKNEQQSLPNPSLAQLEAQIQHHAARTIVGTSDNVAYHKAALETAINAKSEAEKHLARHQEINQQLARLNNDLQMAEQLERVAQAQSASERCKQAYAEYVHASKQCARAFRRVLNENMMASNVKGAVTSPLDLRLHLPALWSQYWAGTVGQHMVEARLPFEESEKENG